MNSNSRPPEDSWESDPIWKLLEQSPMKTAGARFADDTVRAARLAADIKPWWSRFFTPVPLAGFAGASAAIALAVFTLLAPSQPSAEQAVVLDSPEAVAIEDIAETETLIAAVDHIDDFSDHELIRLIGF